MNISSNLKTEKSEFVENNCINWYENGDCQLFIDKRTDLNPAFDDEDNENYCVFIHQDECRYFKGEK